MSKALAPSRPVAGIRRSAAQFKLRAAVLWREYPRETLGFGVLAIVCGLAVGTAAGTRGSIAPAASAPPAPPPLLVRKIPAVQALKVNAQIPLSGGPNPAAVPFRFKGNSEAREQAVECLSSAIYYEAGSQDDDGQRAVAQVVLNRVRHPAFPASVCNVVYQGSTRLTGCQFTFTCDGSLNRQPDLAGWRRAHKIAEAALSGSIYAPVGWATHYHADYVVPYWASTMAKSAVVGAHIFYRWAGGWGQPGVFTKGYSGNEPSARLLRNAALAAAHVAAASQTGVAEAIKDIPGAEPLKLAPSMRGDQRIALRFILAARKASEEAPHQDYTRRFEASDTLKWSLSSDSAPSGEKPLGRAAAAPRAEGGSALPSTQH